MGAQPTTVKTAISVGNAEEHGNENHAGKKGAPHNLQRGCGGINLAMGQRINAKRPALPQKPELGLVQIEAEPQKVIQPTVHQKVPYILLLMHEVEQVRW